MFPNEVHLVLFQGGCTRFLLACYLVFCVVGGRGLSLVTLLRNEQTVKKLSLSIKGILCLILSDQLSWSWIYVLMNKLLQQCDRVKTQNGSSVAQTTATTFQDKGILNNTGIGLHFLSLCHGGSVTYLPGKAWRSVNIFTTFRLS